jgi:hypothetical protein
VVKRQLDIAAWEVERFLGLRLCTRGFQNKEKLFLTVLAKRTNEAFHQFSIPFRREGSVRETLLVVAKFVFSVLLTAQYLALVRIV